MKANELPEKIYLNPDAVPHNQSGKFLFIHNSDIDESKCTIEYVRKDAFIEKTCEKLEKCMYDNLMFQGRLHRKEIIETFVENFKKYIED